MLGFASTSPLKSRFSTQGFLIFGKSGSQCESLNTTVITISFLQVIRCITFKQLTVQNQTLRIRTEISKLFQNMYKIHKP